MTSPTLDINNLKRATYKIIINLSPTCKLTDMSVVGATQVPIQNTIISSCGSNGSILLNTAATNQYLWSSGATTKDLLHLISGIYSVTVTGPLACAQSSTFTVPRDSALKITNNYSIVSGQPCHRRTGGKISIADPNFVIGGVQPYTFYEIRNNVRYRIIDATQNVSTLDSIRIEVEDAIGCMVQKKLLMPYGGFPPLVGIENYPICDINSSNNEQDTELKFDVPLGSNWNFEAKINGVITTDVVPGSNNIFLNGSAGLYQLRFIDKNNAECDTTYTWTKQTIANALPLTYNVTKTNACGSIPGTIKVSMGGGLGEYSIMVNRIEHNIANPLFHLMSGQVKSIPAGTYQVTMRDDCQGNIIDTIEINGTIDIRISPYMDDCHGKGIASHVLASASGTYPPFTFAWSTGVNTAMSILPSNTRPIVTVTDAQGCKNTRQAEQLYYLGSSSKVSITTVPACPLSTSGSATITVQNNANEKVEIFFNNIKLMNPSYQSTVSLTIPFLTPDEDYAVAIIIGNCDGYRQVLRIPSKPLTEVHKRLIKVKDGAYLCEYDVFCEGQLVFENLTHPVQATTEFHSSNLRCNKWKYECGTNSVTEDMESQWARGIQLLYLRSAVGFDVLFNDNLPIQDCALYKICEDGKRASGRVNLACSEKELVGDDGGACQTYRCVCLLEPLGPIGYLPFTVCANETPERYKNYLELFRSNCRDILKVRGYRVSNGTFPGLNDLRYVGSTLQTFIDANSSRPEFKCSEMYYCVTEGTFKFIASNINEVQCGAQVYCASCAPTSFPIYNCDLITSTQDNITFVACGNAFYGPLRTTLQACTDSVIIEVDNDFGSLRNVIECVNNETIYLDYDKHPNPFKLDSILKISKKINIKGIGVHRPKIDLTQNASKIALDNNIIEIENIDILTNPLGESFINSGYLLLKDVNIIGKNVYPKFENKLFLSVDGNFKLIKGP
jgi:hypothetical protein